MLVLAAGASAYANDFPENSETRKGFREYITAPTADVLALKPFVARQKLDGLRVNFKVETQDESFYLLFINEKDGKFPLYGRGSYIIKRSLDDGAFVQVKVFLNGEPDCFVRIYPFGDRAEMEIVMFGKPLYSKINLPYSFADVLVIPFADIIESAAGTVKWNLLLPEVTDNTFSLKQSMVTQIREILPELEDADDGALDANGRWVYIETLKLQEGKGFNCSGFVKWVADSIFYGITGKYMSIENLKNKFLEERGNRWSDHHEDDRDPYFGLDWTRNIAAKIQTARRCEISGYEDNDVRSVPWSDWTEDVGFPIDDLKLVLYYLSVTEPDYIYLASINTSYGTEPVLRQHVHTAVMFPYLDDDGRFRDVVMERNFESDSESLKGRYEGAHVHLVRVRPVFGYKLPAVNEQHGFGPENFLRR